MGEIYKIKSKNSCMFRQSRIISKTVRANVSMHYVLVWWFKEIIKPLSKEWGILGWKWRKSKSRLIKFGRHAQKDAQVAGHKAETFDFPGFAHYCSISREDKEGRN